MKCPLMKECLGISECSSLPPEAVSDSQAPPMIKRCLHSRAKSACRSGLTEVDHQVTRWLVEQVRVPIVLAANKAERMRSAGSGESELGEEVKLPGVEMSES